LNPGPHGPVRLLIYRLCGPVHGQFANTVLKPIEKRRMGGLLESTGWSVSAAASLLSVEEVTSLGPYPVQSFRDRAVVLVPEGSGDFG
jgi:hypothetical protein